MVMPGLEINLDLSATVQQPSSLCSAGSVPNRDKDKYPVDDINDPTPYTLMYVKGRTSRTIEVAEATMMPSRKLHGRPIPAECALVEVAMIREGREFENLDYLDEHEGIDKLVDAKGTFILWPRKDIIVKTYFSPIVLPWRIETASTPTSNMPKLAQISHPSMTPPFAQNSQDPELQENTERRLTSLAKESGGLELQGIKERMLPSPARDQELKGNKEPSSPAGDNELLGKKEFMPPSPPSQVPDI
jgi:hypothetical protein